MRFHNDANVIKFFGPKNHFGSEKTRKMISDYFLAF